MSDDDRAMAMLARLDEKTDLVVQDVGRLRHVLLEGNGTPALTVQVARLDERVSAMERTRLSPGEKILLFSAIAGGAFSIIDVALRLLGH